MASILAPTTFALACLFTAGSATAACPPQGKTRAELLALRDAGFVVATKPDAKTTSGLAASSSKAGIGTDAKDDGKPVDATPKPLDALALGLVDCLANPDPVLRDEVAYGALNHWILGEQLDKATREQLATQLVERLESNAADSGGFRKPFAALVLADLVAADNTKRYLSDTQLRGIADAATAYMASIRDYRGFDAAAGWRHGVAHAADLLGQLAANRRVDDERLGRMLVAISAQAAPESGHFYLYGEPQRLAVPVFYIAQRGLLQASEWSDWFADIADVPEDGSMFTSQAVLARRHNLQGLLFALYVNANESKDEALRASLLEPVTGALRALQ